MLVSLNWLRDYVDIPWAPEELADRLTMAGLEVEGITYLNPGLDNVRVGRILHELRTPRRGAVRLQRRCGRRRSSADRLRCAKHSGRTDSDRGAAWRRPARWFHN